MTEHFATGLPTPAPVIDPQTQPYWAAAAAGRLVLPWCLVCDRAFWYPRGFCPRCGSTDLDWRESPGRGRLYSWTVVRRAGGVWGAHVPFVFGLVTLDEGIVVQANVVDADTAQLDIDLALEALFEVSGEDEPPVLRFRPVPR